MTVEFQPPHLTPTLTAERMGRIEREQGLPQGAEQFLAEPA